MTRVNERYPSELVPATTTPSTWTRISTPSALIAVRPTRRSSAVGPANRRSVPARAATAATTIAASATRAPPTSSIASPTGSVHSTVIIPNTAAAAAPASATQGRTPSRGSGCRRPSQPAAARKAMHRPETARWNISMAGFSTQVACKPGEIRSG